MKISVSYLTSNYEKKQTIKLIEKTNADYIHVDLMDGGFVEHKNFKIEEVLALLSDHQKPLDIHLMVFDPLIYIKELAKLNPSYITFHLEATKDIVGTIKEIRKYGIKVGLSLRPNTDIHEIMPYLALVDLILIMSVNPGAGGQSFISASSDRLEELRKIRAENNLSFLIAMDGGINNETIKLVKDLDIAVSGSFICKSTNYQAQIDKLRE